MGGWKDVIPYTLDKEKLRKCKCGKGYIISAIKVEEESDYPPFERGSEFTYSSCPDKCETAYK